MVFGSTEILIESTFLFRMYILNVFFNTLNELREEPALGGRKLSGFWEFFEQGKIRWI